MKDISKEFKRKLLSDMLRALAATGKTISLQEGNMQFPGAPPITIGYHPDHAQAGIHLTIGKEKSPGDWTEEARLSMDDYAHAGSPDGSGDGALAAFLRSICRDVLEPHNRFTVGQDTPGHYAVNAHRDENEHEQSRLCLTFHPSDAEKIADSITKMREAYTSPKQTALGTLLEGKPEQTFPHGAMRA